MSGFTRGIWLKIILFCLKRVMSVMFVLFSMGPGMTVILAIMVGSLNSIGYFDLLRTIAFIFPFLSLETARTIWTPGFEGSSSRGSTIKFCRWKQVSLSPRKRGISRSIIWV